MRLTKKQRAEAKEALECAMCVGNRQLLTAIQQDVTAMREQLASTPATALETLRMEVADLHPGDVLVVSAPERLDDEEVAVIREGIHTKFPGIEGIVIDGGMHISVIRPEGAPS